MIPQQVKYDILMLTARMLSCVQMIYNFIHHTVANISKKHTNKRTVVLPWYKIAIFGKLTSFDLLQLASHSYQQCLVLIAVLTTMTWNLLPIFFTWFYRHYNSTRPMTFLGIFILIYIFIHQKVLVYTQDSALRGLLGGDTLHNSMFYLALDFGFAYR